MSDELKGGDALRFNHLTTEKTLQVQPYSLPVRKGVSQEWHLAIDNTLEKIERGHLFAFFKNFHCQAHLVF
jgi:hypothetical protein